MSSRLPSDALRTRTSPIKVAIIAIAAVVLVGGLGTAAFAIGPSLRAGLNHPTASAAPVDTVPTLSASELKSVQQAADAQQATIVADEAAAQAAAQAAAVQQTTQPNVTKCPAGTKANAVDAAGNESICQPLNSAGQSCQAYDDNNNCTAWGALSETPLKP